ncbi:MAG: N-acetyl sugar amidotransferase [Bacteroidia bacterium]
MAFEFLYDLEKLKSDTEANFGRPYQQCAISVMDTIADPNIRFDENGICNYYYEYKKTINDLRLTDSEYREIKLQETIQLIKANKGKNKYDCILGLSGGVDSSYLCILAKEYELNPLVVHFDNGWNSELAQKNIEHLIKITGFDLYTYVVDWEEFKELQLSYLKASVVDIEVLTDHAFMAVLFEQAKKWNIKYMLAGMNLVTEFVLPSYWIYNKGDLQNIINIQNRFGNKPFSKLKTYPKLSVETSFYCKNILKMEVLAPLNYIDYTYQDAKKILVEKYSWKDYGGKHFESIFTRFYQGYILPCKFNIDKRKAHLSNLIFSNQLTKSEAESILKNPPYDLKIMEEDYYYILKKFNLSEEEFSKLMQSPRIEHEFYGKGINIVEKYKFLSLLKPVYKLILNK